MSHFQLLISIYSRTMSTYSDAYYYADNYNYTEYYMQLTGLNQSAALFVGIGYLLFAAISLLFYSRLLTVKNKFYETHVSLQIIIYDKNLNQLSAYQIIFQNGLADSLMLLLWMISGIFSILLSTFNSTFIKVLFFC